MKKIIIIDGGPRKTFNTASMLQKIAEGAASVSEEIEVKTVRLYGMDYKGCMSCLACKIKDKAVNVCKFRDDLTPVLEEVAQADGLVMGSPIYFSEVTAQLRAFLERLIFPWLSYNDYSLTAPKRIPVILTYTMNANAEMAKGVYQAMGIIEVKKENEDTNKLSLYKSLIEEYKLKIDIYEIYLKSKNHVEFIWLSN